MNTYFIRAIEADWQALIDYGIRLGAITQIDDRISATHGGQWDYIGIIQKPTSELDSEGRPITTPIVDEQGSPYLHANLATPLDLLAIGQQLAQDDPDIAAALSELAKYFVINPVTGLAGRPNQPYRVFAGDA